jgi:hypothetical protein
MVHVKNSIWKLDSYFWLSSEWTIWRIQKKSPIYQFQLLFTGINQTLTKRSLTKKWLELGCWFDSLPFSHEITWKIANLSSCTLLQRTVNFFCPEPPPPCEPCRTAHSDTRKACREVFNDLPSIEWFKFSQLAPQNMLRTQTNINMDTSSYYKSKNVKNVPSQSHRHFC